MNIKETLEQHALWLKDRTQGKRADLREANLRGADLYRADLYGADLREADLWNCTGNNKEVKTVQAGTYTITYTADIVQIGCQRHSLAEWQAFSKDEIAAMDSNAAEWWKAWKSLLAQIITASPAK